MYNHQTFGEPQAEIPTGRVSTKAIPEDKKLRESGIPVVGPMPWGTHLCAFYETRRDLIEGLVPYFKAGLENDEFCLCVCSESEAEEIRNALRAVVPDFDRYLADRSMEFHSTLEWYVNGGGFGIHRVLDSWNEKLKEAVARGYPGMRVSGDTAWIYEKDWRGFCEYEGTLDGYLEGKRMIVLCTYSLKDSPATQIMDAACVHQRIVARRMGRWEIVETAEFKQAREEIEAELRAANEAREIGEQKFRDISRRLVEAQENERRRLARELHDEVGQALTAAKIYIDMLASDVSHGRAERLRESAALLDQLLRQVRQFSADLRPPVLDDLGLVPALRSLFKQQTRLARLTMRFDASGVQGTIDKETQTACYRIAQESLTNILRHARAHSVKCSLSALDDMLCLTITDDGEGFDPSTVEQGNGHPGGYGLLGIKERAALLDGNVRIASSPGKGTVIDVRLPLRPI